ncbi:hypothetical protein J6590_003854 [Homalodisca vitripennis]|nr:hypothetical protein J6590_003854 [Homalodisca vitripennis]
MVIHLRKRGESRFGKVISLPSIGNTTNLSNSAHFPSSSFFRQPFYFLSMNFWAHFNRISKDFLFASFVSPSSQIPYLVDFLPALINYMERRDRFASAFKTYFLQRIDVAVGPENTPYSVSVMSQNFIGVPTYLSLRAEAVIDLTPEIWSQVRLKRFKKVDDVETQDELVKSFRHQRQLGDLQSRRLILALAVERIGEWRHDNTGGDIVNYCTTLTPTIDYAQSRSCSNSEEEEEESKYSCRMDENPIHRSGSEQETLS